MKTHHYVELKGKPQPITVESSKDQFVVQIGDETLRFDVHATGPREYELLQRDSHGVVHDLLVAGNSAHVVVHHRDGSAAFKILDEKQLARQAISRRGAMGGAEGELLIEAPMPGRVVKCLVSVGDDVQAGQGVIVVEAMKMENELRSSVAGMVKKVAAAEGDDVEAGHTLVVIEASSDE